MVFLLPNLLTLDTIGSSVLLPDHAFVLYKSKAANKFSFSYQNTGILGFSQIARLNLFLSAQLWFYLNDLKSFFGCQTVGFSCKMSDDMMIHFSSNSSNQSDQSLPTKIAKLEARMVGKASSVASTPVQPQQLQQQPTWSSISSTVKFGPAEDLSEQLSSSDSDDDVSSCLSLYVYMHIELGPYPCWN